MANKRNIIKEVETELLARIYPAIGIDRPSNHDNIVAFITDDIKEAACANNWHSEDVSIGFRRYLENVNEK
jgi:hypothetical protein